MTFSNPASNATAAASAYVRALLELLGQRNPIEVIGELLPWLDQRLQGVAEQTLRRPEKPGKWSALEVIQHLADSDLVMGFRTRMVLSEDSPAMQGYDQDRWAREFQYRDISLRQALDQLHGLRRANLNLWTQLTPAQLDRVGLHSERGPESVEHMIQLIAGHDLVHRRQIDRILTGMGGTVTR
jgi:hypothetical protein